MKSDEAAKLFDAVFRQFIAFTDYDAFGGLEASVKAMLEAEPDFGIF